MDEDFRRENNIVVVPLKVRFGDKTYIEGVNITPDEFYEKLESEKTLPKTSQPSIQDFISAYKPILENGDEIISIHISSGLSGTFNAARMAAEQLDPSKIKLVDSKHTSMILCFLAEHAVSEIKKGKSLEEVYQSTLALVPKMITRFTFWDIKYLVQGGRLSKAEGIIGSILSIKPILSFTNGVVKTEATPRTWKRALRKLAEYVKEIYETRGIEKLGVIYGTNKAEAQEFANRLKEMVNTEVRMQQLGAVVGTYAGPRWIGIGIQAKRD
jgi:DegV family protein with EDD domain